MCYTIESDSLFIGQQLLHFDVLHSTNDHLKNLVAKGGCKEGLTVTTDYQTSGRGQIGNSWESEEGNNLLMSVYLAPKFLPASQFFYLNMSVCLAVVDALNYITPGFQVKWPNDILFDKTKVAGILIESTIAGGVVQSCVAGVGININQSKFVTKGNFSPGSLRQILGNALDKGYVQKIVLKSLEARYLQLRQRPSILRQDYFDVLYGYKQPVPVIIDSKPDNAVITDVMADGQLVVLVNRTERRFLFKEISFTT
jgi:BirA family biotin operon repressor/biotin-[acetyl-CoA-carboxylase] ligase